MKKTFKNVVLSYNVKVYIKLINYIFIFDFKITKNMLTYFAGLYFELCLLNIFRLLQATMVKNKN